VLDRAYLGSAVLKIGYLFVITEVTRYCNALLFGVTSTVARYYLPEITLSVTSYFLQYTSVLRPVLRPVLACPVWHSSLTVAQSDALESVQNAPFT